MVSPKFPNRIPENLNYQGNVRFVYDKPMNQWTVPMCFQWIKVLISMIETKIPAIDSVMGKTKTKNRNGLNLKGTSG